MGEKGKEKTAPEGATQERLGFQICPRCKKGYWPTDNFCTWCGTKLRRQEVLEHLKRMSNDDLVNVYHAFNRWKWPDSLEKPPEFWDKLPNWNGEVTKYGYTKPFMLYIQSRMPHEELLRRARANGLT